MPALLRRQRTGSVVCPSCGKLVGVNDEKCLNCGRRNPGMWGFAQSFRRLGQDFGFAAVVIGGSIALYAAALLIDPSGIGRGGFFTALSPTMKSLFLLGASGAIPVFELGVGGRFSRPHGSTAGRSTCSSTCCGSASSRPRPRRPTGRPA